MTKFLENVLHLLSEKGISKNKMLTELKLGKNSFVNWESRGTIPSGTTLHKIAEYFNVSTDYLLGTETPEEPLDETDQQILMLARKSRVLSPEDKETLYSMAAETPAAFEKLRRILPSEGDRLDELPGMLMEIFIASL